MKDDHEDSEMSEYEKHIYTHTLPRIQHEKKRRFRHIVLGIAIGLIAAVAVATIVSTAGLAIPVLVGIGIAVAVVVGTSTAWGIRHRDKYSPKVFKESSIKPSEKVTSAPSFNFIARWKSALPTSKITAIHKIQNKTLAMNIENKYRSVSKTTVPVKELPSAKLMQDFVDAINLKLGEMDGLNYVTYLKILMAFEKKSPTFPILFGISSECFDKEKSFKVDRRASVQNIQLSLLSAKKGHKKE